MLTTTPPPTTSTTSEPKATNFFPYQVSSGVTCLSVNVGSATDFLSPTTHSSSASRIDEETSTASPVSQHDLPDDPAKYSPSRLSPPMEHESPGDSTPSVGKEKLGHRRVDETGAITYKRVMVDDLIKCLQIGLKHVIGQTHQPRRQVLVQDFQETDYQDFPP